MEYLILEIERFLSRGHPRSGKLPSYIVAPVFPAYFVCEQVETATVAGKPVRRRRLVRWQDLDARGGRRKFNFDDGKKSDVTPIRFVCACENGHLQDIAWKWVVHGNKPCQEPMWLEERGTSADPADMSIVCGCGEELSLQALFQAGRMGNCRGERPWLLDRDANGCGLKLKLLTRTATNTYFPQVYTVISLPVEDDELTRLVDELSGELANVHSVEHVASAKQFNSKVRPHWNVIPMRRSWRGSPVFAREQVRTLDVPRSCPNSTCSRPAGRRSDRTFPMRSSMPRRYGARHGPTRVRGLIFP